LEYVHAKTKSNNFSTKYPYIRNQEDVMTLLALTVVLIFDPIQYRGLDGDMAVNNLITTFNNINGSVKYNHSTSDSDVRYYDKLYRLYQTYQSYLASNPVLTGYLNSLFSPGSVQIAQRYLRGVRQ